MVVIINLWTVMVYSSAHWESICSTYHSFPFPFVYLRRDFLFATRRVCLEKKTLTVPVHLAYASCFNWIWVANWLLFLCTYHFDYLMFFVMCICISFLSLSFDCLLISARILDEGHKIKTTKSIPKEDSYFHWGKCRCSKMISIFVFN